jgi:hypothetical protein
MSAVPEVTVTEDGNPAPPQHDIWSPEDPLRIETVSKPLPPKGSPQQ